jgi:cold-inducible RNA-binding protein
MLPNEKKREKMNIYVGNLNYRLDENGLRKVFEQHGEVSRVSIISDRETGRSKGFGFVEMPDDNAAMNAISALNGQDCEGRTLVVNQARDKGNSY